MQRRSVDDMAEFIMGRLIEYFGNRIGGFVLEEKADSDSYQGFTIEFNAYNYFPIVFRYDRGHIGFSICYGERNIGLNNSQKWLEKADFNQMLQELKEELELRIPDKYLESRGWK